MAMAEPNEITMTSVGANRMPEHRAGNPLRRQPGECDRAETGETANGGLLRTHSRSSLTHPAQGLNVKSGTQ